MKTKKTGAWFFYGYVIVAAAALINVGVIGVFYSFGVFFKPLLADFGWTRAQLSSVQSFAWIAQGLAAVGFGFLTDRFGPRKVITVSGIILALGYMLMYTVNDFWQLYLFYSLMAGGGLGGIVVPGLSVVAHWFVKRRNVMTGIVVAGMGIGMLVVPLAATSLILNYSWRIAYLVLGAIVLVAVAVLAQFLRREPAERGLAAYGATQPVVKTSTTGMLAKDAMRTLQFWLITLIFFLLGYSVYVIMVHIVPYATDANIDPTTAAGLLSTIGGVSILGKVIFGTIGDRTGSRNAYILAFILMLASLLWVTQIKGVALLYVFAGVFALAYGGLSTSQSPLIATIFGLRAHGLIFALANVGFSVGAATGPYIAGFIFDVTKSYQWAFLIAAASAAVGIAASVAIKPIKSRKTV